MRRRRNLQLTMLAFIDLEERVQTSHPLRTVKRPADEALGDLSSTFDGMYAKDGRPSIPPERLLKASLLIALYSVWSERAFCEELEYHLLFRRFPLPDPPHQARLSSGGRRPKSTLRALGSRSRPSSA